MTVKANWNYPTAVRFGAGRINELPEALKVAGISKPLLVTDAGLVNLPVTQQTLALLRDASIEAGVFADVKPNPISANVNAGVEVLGPALHGGFVRSIYFFDPNGIRLELTLTTSKQEELQRFHREARAACDTWTRDKAARQAVAV